MELHLPHQLPVHSRIGCWALAAVGVIVSLASAALFVYSIVDTWGYASLIDHAIQVMLVGMTVIGAAVATVAWRNAERSEVRGQRS